MPTFTLANNSHLKISFTHANQYRKSKEFPPYCNCDKKISIISHNPDWRRIMRGNEARIIASAFAQEIGESRRCRP